MEAEFAVVSVIKIIFQIMMTPQPEHERLGFSSVKEISVLECMDVKWWKENSNTYSIHSIHF